MVTKEKMKQKPKCPLSSGLLSSPTVYRKEKGDSTVLVSSHHLKKSLCQQQAEGFKSCLTHTCIHIQPSRGSQYRYSFVSLKLHHIIIVLINMIIQYNAEQSQQRLTNRTTPTTSLIIARAVPSVGRAPPRVDMKARRAPSPPPKARPCPTIHCCIECFWKQTNKRCQCIYWIWVLFILSIDLTLLTPAMWLLPCRFYRSPMVVVALTGSKPLLRWWCGEECFSVGFHIDFHNVSVPSWLQRQRLLSVCSSTF